MMPCCQNPLQHAPGNPSDGILLPVSVADRLRPALLWNADAVIAAANAEADFRPFCSHRFLYPYHPNRGVLADQNAIRRRFVGLSTTPVPRTLKCTDYPLTRFAYPYGTSGSDWLPLTVSLNDYSLSGRVDGG
jgi:hypothetical protein